MYQFTCFILVTASLCIIGLCPTDAGCVCGSNTQRGTDSHGSGAYGASRGSRRHAGIDLVCPAGSAVKAPFRGSIVRRSFPYDLSRYPNKAAINNGVVFSATGSENGENCVKIWYITPVRYRIGQIFLQGETIGTQLNMQGVYPEITNHVHVQKCGRNPPNPSALLSC